MSDPLSHFWSFMGSFFQCLPSPFLAFVFWFCAFVLIIGLISFFVRLIK